MSVDAAEKKWQEAKSSVDKTKYDTDNSYFAVVTTVFKKMMGENTMFETLEIKEIPIIHCFEQYIDERQNNEFDANRHLSTSGSSSSSSFSSSHSSFNSNDEKRKHELHSAAYRHVIKGQHKQAHDAAYKLAHAHAIEDRHGPDAAHEIATRRAKQAVKKAQDTVNR
jgi:hypothetical protein